MRALIAAAMCIAVSACGSVPKVDDTPVPQNSTSIVSVKGPLTNRQSKALLAKLAQEPGDSGILNRHIAIEQAIAETPLVSGNSTKILVDGEKTFAAMFDLIKSAKKTINLEYYIFEDVISGGQRLGDLLIAKRNTGVAINIIYDSYGSASTPSMFFRRLKDAGINLVDFNPVNPLDPIDLNKRDHRKILVVDGEHAIVGGINLSTTYESSGLGKSGNDANSTEQHWRDTDLEIDGPAAAQLQDLFLKHWAEQKGPPLNPDQYFPKIGAKGGEVVRIVGSTPEKAVPRFYVTLLSAIRSAEKNIWLSAAYFVPTDQEEEDLIGAAKRGVDVRLVLPSDSDSKMALAIGRSHYGYLLEAGVKIYEIQNAVLHSKTASIDGVWTAIGSSNFDPRSVVFNDEVDAIVLGSATARELESLFNADIGAAKEIDGATWKRRPLGERLLELFELSSFLWQNML